MADCAEFADEWDWSEADRSAMREWIDGRLRDQLLGFLDKVRSYQDALVKTPALTGAFACMWRAGCHPLQDAGDGDLGGDTPT